MLNKTMIFVSALLVFISVSASSALSQDLMVYPAQGQSQEQLDKDKSDCYTWAKQQTGAPCSLNPYPSHPLRVSSAVERESEEQCMGPLSEL